MQLHYGPKNYDDPEEVAKYLLMPGVEKTDCIFVKTPNDVEVFHAEYHGRMRPGSHHLLVFTRSSPMADSVAPEACNQGTDSAMILGAQTPTIDIDNTRGAAPENEGTAQRLAPHAQAVIQVHYLNTSSKPMLREAWANVIYRDPSTVKTLTDPIFFLAGIGANIRPGTTHISRGQATASREMRLISATGHYHAHTVRFSAWSVIGGERNQILEDYDWHEPREWRFNSGTTNTLPDGVGPEGGSLNGVLMANPGDEFQWECEIQNRSTSTLTFSNRVYDGEMCNVFGFYAVPRFPENPNRRSWLCAFF